MARQFTLLTLLVALLLALASASVANDKNTKKATREVDLNLAALQQLHMIKKQYNDLRAELESEDEDAPGGSLDYPHTQPFHTTLEDQVSHAQTCVMPFSLSHTQLGRLSTMWSSRRKCTCSIKMSILQHMVERRPTTCMFNRSLGPKALRQDTTQVKQEVCDELP